MAEAPHQLLEKHLQHQVILTLKDARRLSGRLLGIDEHLNLALDAVEESTAEMTRRLGRVVLRGSNVVSLQVPEGTPARSG